MKPETMPTQSQVESRIAEVVALNELCESLALAGRQLKLADQSPTPKK